MRTTAPTPEHGGPPPSAQHRAPGIDAPVPRAPVCLSSRPDGARGARPVEGARGSDGPVRRSAQELLGSADTGYVRRMIGGPEVEAVEDVLTPDRVRDAVRRAGLVASGIGGDCDEETRKASPKLRRLLPSATVGCRGILFWRRDPDNPRGDGPDYPGHTLQDHIAVRVVSGATVYIVDTSITQFAGLPQDFIEDGIFVGPLPVWEGMLVALGEYPVVEVADRYLGGRLIELSAEFRWPVPADQPADRPPHRPEDHPADQPRRGCSCVIV